MLKLWVFLGLNVPDLWRSCMSEALLILRAAHMRAERAAWAAAVYARINDMPDDPAKDFLAGSGDQRNRKADVDAAYARGALIAMARTSTNGN